jgi:hypothetical protein
MTRITDKIVAAHDQLSPSFDEIRISLKHLCQVTRKYVASRIQQKIALEKDFGRVLVGRLTKALINASSWLTMGVRWPIRLAQHEPERQAMAL